MHFRFRAIMGLLQFIVTVAFLLGALLLIFNAQSDRGSGRGGAGGDRAQNERSFAVDTVTLTQSQIRPTITAFGEVISGRTLELRSAAAGALVNLSPRFFGRGQRICGGVIISNGSICAKCRLATGTGQLCRS